MKRYKPLLMQVGILLLVLSLGLYLLEQRTRFYTVDFSKQYSKYRTIELARFEDGEGWQGNFSYDSERTFEGKASITLSSWYGQTNTIQSNTNSAISPGYTNGYISVFVAEKKNPSSLASFSLTLKGGNDQEKKYDLTPLIHEGWNRIAITIPNWKTITYKSFSILSQTGTVAEVNIDRFWIENTTAYTSDVFSTKSQSLSLRTIGERTYVFSASPGLEDYSLTTPSSIQKGSIIISLIPERAKEMLLSLNGTAMKLAGKNMNECTLTHDNETPLTKILKTTSGNNDLYVFLKAKVKNGKVAYSLSNNGVDYESCGTVAFTQKKPVQLSLMGSYLIDSYSAEY